MKENQKKKGKGLAIVGAFMRNNIQPDISGWLRSRWRLLDCEHSAEFSCMSLSPILAYNNCFTDQARPLECWTHSHMYRTPMHRQLWPPRDPSLNMHSFDARELRNGERPTWLM